MKDLEVLYLVFIACALVSYLCPLSHNIPLVKIIGSNNEIFMPLQY